MLKKTIEILFQRHGIPINDIEKANQTIEFILFDNPSVFYPQNRQNGIYDIDWTNEIMYIREHRKDVMYDDHDRSEICLEFENIQRIAFKINRVDYEKALAPNTTIQSVTAALTDYVYPITSYNAELKRTMSEKYDTIITNMALSYSLEYAYGDFRNEILAFVPEVIDEIGTVLELYSQPKYDILTTRLVDIKEDIINDNMHVSHSSAELVGYLETAIGVSVNIETIESLFEENMEETIDQFIRHKITDKLNALKLTVSHSSELNSEVKFKIIEPVIDEITLNSEVTLIKMGESHIDAEMQLLKSGQRYVNAEVNLSIGEPVE